MQYVFVFIAWTFVIYWMHRLAHAMPFIANIHADHHKYVVKNTVTWHWSNLFLYNDTWLSTLDLWITEVIPTVIISYFCGWWLLVAYYIWAAFVQERIEHNESFNYYPFITSGRWHMIHHRNATVNFGIFFPVWDILFRTSRSLDDSRK
jgi:sterol desaturase/sphingolipid hydroxylase (fatty acid hydroxylase superfamily)